MYTLYLYYGTIQARITTKTTKLPHPSFYSIDFLKEFPLASFLVLVPYLYSCGIAVTPVSLKKVVCCGIRLGRYLTGS